VLTYWHRPLHAMTDAFTHAGFRIAVIREPSPAPGARELFPDVLATFPSGAFLCFLFFVLEAAECDIGLCSPLPDSFDERRVPRQLSEPDAVVQPAGLGMPGRT
jgi:hypothetical protein